MTGEPVRRRTTAESVAPLAIQRASVGTVDALARLFDAVPPLQCRPRFSRAFHRALARHCATDSGALTLIGFWDGDAVGYSLALTARRGFFLRFARRYPWLYLRHLGAHTFRTLARRVAARRYPTNMPLLTTGGERAVYMQTTGTDPRFRRTGIGRRLKAAMVETARAEGYTILYSQMRPDKGRWAAAANKDGWQMERQPDGSFMGFYRIRKE